MRILWVANAPWAPSGYGQQTALFVPRLKALGHELAIACNFGLQGTRLDWNGVTCYPSDNEWGNRSLATYARDHEADLVLILHDAWVLTPQAWPEGTSAAVWAPVDHYPIPPVVLAVLANDRIRPVAISRFGETLMRDAGLDACYVPHGIDTTVFRPAPELRAQARELLEVPQDAFLVGMVAANKGNPAIPRKGFPQAFHTFARFARAHDDAWMYVHSEARPSPGGGINLDTLASVVGVPDGRLRFPPDQAWQLGVSRDMLAVIYQAFDVLLNPSMGEGFGIPILEAQACGVPVIASDHSAMTELTQAGWLVQGDPWWDALQDSFFVCPAIDSVLAALEAAYTERDNTELHNAAAAFAASYDADVVTIDYWQPVLAELAAPREVAPLNGALNRAQRRALQKAAR